MMRYPMICLTILSLSGCAATPNADAVRDGTAPLRQAHAAALIGPDLTEMRRTGERLLTALACGWGEPECPTG